MFHINCLFKYINRLDNQRCRQIPNRKSIVRNALRDNRNNGGGRGSTSLKILLNLYLKNKNRAGLLLHINGLFKYINRLNNKRNLTIPNRKSIVQSALRDNRKLGWERGVTINIIKFSLFLLLKIMKIGQTCCFP